MKNGPPDGVTGRWTNSTSGGRSGPANTPKTCNRNHPIAPFNQPDRQCALRKKLDFVVSGQASSFGTRGVIIDSLQQGTPLRPPPLRRASSMDSTVDEHTPDVTIQNCESKELDHIDLVAGLREEWP